LGLSDLRENSSRVSIRHRPGEAGEKQDPCQNRKRIGKKSRPIWQISAQFGLASIEIDGDSATAAMGSTFAFRLLGLATTYRLTKGRFLQLVG
jgi:hypothetical protein